MKSSGQILQDLGFNKNSSDSAKAAFIKHLIKAASGHDVTLPNFTGIEKQNKVAPPTMQLCFDLDSAVSFQEAI